MSPSSHRTINGTRLYITLTLHAQVTGFASILRSFLDGLVRNLCTTCTRRCAFRPLTPRDVVLAVDRARMIVTAALLLPVTASNTAVKRSAYSTSRTRGFAATARACARAPERPVGQYTIAGARFQICASACVDQNRAFSTSADGSANNTARATLHACTATRMIAL